MDKNYSELLSEKIELVNSTKSTAKLKLRDKFKKEEWFFSFDSLPNNWKQVNILDVTWLVTCGVAKKPEYVDEGIPFLSAQNARPFKANLNKIKYITQEQFDTLTVGGKPELNDILYTRVGNCGEAAKVIFDFDFGVYVSLTLIKPIHKLINTDYLVAFLNSHYGLTQANVGAIGSGLKNLNVNNVRKYKIPLPPLPEQQRIVAKLDDLFGHLEQVKTRLEKIPGLLKNFRQAILTQAVTGKLTEEWRKGKELEDANVWRRNVIKERSEFGLPKRTPGLVYENIEGGLELPDNWTYGFLQNFGEFTRGKSKHRPRNDKKLFGGDYPYIQTGEVARSNGLITEYKNTYSEFGLTQSRLFPKGTLCITIAANIAETGILDFDACFPDSVVGYIPFKDYYTTNFAMCCLRVMQKDIEHYAPATAQKNINLGILFEVPFPVPPKEEQTEIVHRVESLFAKADAIEAKYNALKAQIDSLPQAILAKAFKGELVEQLPTDGNAADLLKEIQKLKTEAQSKGNKKKKKSIKA